MCAYHNGQRIPNSHGIALHSSTRSKVGFFTERDAHELDDVDEEDEEEKEVDADGYDDNDGDGNDDARCDDFGNVGYDKVRSDTDVVLRETSKPCWVRRLWIQKQLLQLVQDRVGIQAEAFELERQQVKWKRFCSKKDRELESLMLENENRRLENERMVIQVRQKEMELDLMKAGEIIQQQRAS
ncbi:hypothetical protein AXF42_Ash001808 [Apostasia shenzhenica]|uniref:Uncharacterized protein n=1 Tax=Apostasia shenzhenica TaxID=1088818 RepID=A0A2I0ABA2_9ASPA|nr:hypothetical protein AXF42_Ash001808 [Apostasia shenzhenica]